MHKTTKLTAAHKDQQTIIIRGLTILRRTHLQVKKAFL